MAKSKNHTNHNQNRKAHRNGIKKPRKFLHESTLGPKHIMEAEQPSKYTYPIQMTNLLERENWIVSTDHCYARPWNWKCNTSFLKPPKTLFMSKNVDINNPLYSVSAVVKDEDVDIESVQEDSILVYDVLKAKDLMEECGKHVAQIRNTTHNVNWEESISKINWSSSQYRLFNGFINILNSFQLAKLAQSGLQNEPILRRTVIDKAVQRVRRLFATVSFDTKLLQWLHLLLIDHLDYENLSSYLDILQTLNCKIPKFVGAILNNPSTSLRFGLLNNENIVPILKKPWDPVATSLYQDKPSKLPGSPILIVVPSSPSSSKRNKKWMSLLSHLGHVVSVPLNFGVTLHRMTMINCIDQMYALTRGRIQEVRDNYPNKHIILVGIGIGAALALQLAQTENIFCVISLGFSLFTVEGKRGDPDDSLLELQCPVLFVIGECSNNSIQENIEDLRERMRVETGLIIVGAADNNLIVSKKKRKEENITQSIVDRCIADEIGDFISGLILSPFPPQIRQSPTNMNLENFKSKKFTERKRYNSTASSVDSETTTAISTLLPVPPAPLPPLTQMQTQSLATVKIPKPVGRPPGKSKNKLNVQANQMANASRNECNSLTSSIGGTHLAQLDTSIVFPSATATQIVPHSLKKIKTLQPIMTSGMETVDKTSCKNLKIFPVSLNQNGSNATTNGGGGGGGHLIHNGIKIMQSQLNNYSFVSGAVKVHENIQISNQTAMKLISTTTTPMDLSRLSNLPNQKNNASNLILMPDGKIKSIASTKPVINLKPTSNNLILSVPQNGKFQSKRNKYIFSKRTTPINQDNSFVTISHPTKNLTSQDIMDLPIIFADDNKLLDSNVVRSSTANLTSTSSSILVESPIRQQQPPPPSPLTTKFVTPISANKFVIVTKSNPLLTSMKRPLTATTISPHSVVPPAAKYPKIVFSKKMITNNTNNDCHQNVETDRAAIDKEITPPQNDDNNQVTSTNIERNDDQTKQ